MKSITINFDDDTYSNIMELVNGQSKEVSSFIEYATLQYINSEINTDDYKLSKDVKEALSNKSENIKVKVSDL